ncbi:MAG: CHASE2 domain-containing protein [Planctomycetota bacterium]|nr:CHASE2 domain-containing protein [Planctomycetota bacterium]
MDTIRTRTRGRTQEFVRQSGGHSAHKPILVSLLVGAVSASFCSYLYFSPPDFLKRFENQVRDSFFPARRTIKTDPSIVFCNVDDEVLRQIGEWPLPRVYYTELIKNLKDAGMIGFDVLFPEKGMISKKESAQATEKFGSLLQVVQAAFSGEGEQDTVLQQLEKIYQEASNSMAGPDGPLSDAAQKHGRVLFPMAFPEEYPGVAELEENNKRFKEIASLLQNEFFRYPELYEAWFDSSPFIALYELKVKLEGKGKPGLGDLNLSDEGEDGKKFTWSYIEGELINIIPRVYEADAQFVLQRLEQEGFIISRKELEEYGAGYDDILVRAMTDAQGQSVDPPLMEIEKSTYRFLTEPLPIYEENKEQFRKWAIHKYPFRITHELIFAKAMGGLLLSNYRDDLAATLEAQASELTEELYNTLDLFIRERITDEDAPRIRDILVDEAGNALETQDQQEAAASTLTTAFKSFTYAKTPLVRFCLASTASSYFSVQKDFDGAVRHYPLVTVRGDRAFFCMGLVMACHYLNVPLKSIRLCPGKFILLPGAQFPDGVTKDIKIPVDERGRMVINWVGRFKNTAIFKHYSFNKVLKSPEYRNELKGKLVLIGFTATGSHDVAPNPFEEEGNYPLVGAHANVLNSILTQSFLQPEIGIRRHLNIIVICVTAMLMALGTGFLSQHWSGIAHLVSSATYIAIAFFLFSLWGEPLNVSFTILGITFSFGGVLLYRYMTEERQKKVVKAMFSTMVSPEVLEYLQESPDRFKLIGEKKLATMFFSDVAGFTTISESLTAEDLAKVLNEYLTPMSNIIMKYNGYIDKYEGDAIMADFGVPLWKDEEEPNSHAWKCCWSALDQMEKLREIQFEIKTRYGCDIDVRMGINTGDVSAGNMGSEQKFQYTVMGDAVNQAARFEPANKEFDTHIMIGEPTYLYAQHKVEARKLAALVVKGKTEPVICYELVGKKGEVSDEMLHLIEKFETGWRHHAIQDFEKAIEYFDECLAIDPKDGPSIKYKGICEDLIKEPPDPAWRGEFIQTSK